MTQDLIEIAKTISKKKKLDEQVKPGNSPYTMADYSSLFDKNNTLTLKHAKPLKPGFMSENDDEPEDEEDREEAAENRKVAAIKRRLSGSPRGVRQEDATNTQSLANKPQPLATKPVGVAKPKRRKKVVANQRNENPENPDEYSQDDLPALLKIVNPDNDETVNSALKAVVRLMLLQVMNKTDDAEDDEPEDDSHMEPEPLSVKESIGFRTEWVKENGRLVEKVIR